MCASLYHMFITRMSNVDCFLKLSSAAVIVLVIVCAYNFSSSSTREQASPNKLSLENVRFGKHCMLPVHPSCGWWSPVNYFLKSSTVLAPANTILEVHCNDTYKLDGCAIVACINGTWFPPIGSCLKTCPPLYSTQKIKVTCIFKEQETMNCTQPIEGTLAHFKCASFYEDPRISRTKAVCVDGKWSEDMPNCSPVCGRRIIRKTPTLIIGGEKSNKGEFPWQIALFTDIDKTLICSGSLLSERVILTAAHCISNSYGMLLPKEDYIIVAGKYYRKFDHPEDTSYIQVSKIEHMFVSDVYEGANQNFAGDIAVIVTKKSFKFSVRIQPICVDWNRDYEKVVLDSDRHSGYVCGWGYTRQTSEQPNELKSIVVPSITRKDCKARLPNDYKIFVTYDKFCAGYRNYGMSVCSGDSGGGLVFKRNDGRYFIAGIVSLAPLANKKEGGCDSQQYSLYTLVYNYTENFILRKVAEFRPSKKSEEICEYCNETSPNTELPTTEATTEFVGPPETPAPEVKQTDNCTLPEHPKFGRWTFSAKRETPSPGMLVPSSTVIEVACKQGYKYDGYDGSLNFCTDGRWTRPFGKCLKACPSLHNLKNMDVICYQKGQTIKDCEPIEGTVVKFKCAMFYEFSNVIPNHAICLDGEWSNVPKCVPVCGQPNNNSTLIIDGRKATKGNFPWHVTIYKSDDNNKTYAGICGGSLISPKVVITAAHCFDTPQLNTAKYIVAAGKHHRQFDHPEDIGAQFSTILELQIHEQYTRSILRKYLADIALVFIDKPFVLSSSVQPVCIDWENDLGHSIHNPAFSNNWGSKSDNQTFGVLILQQFSVVSKTRCLEEFSSVEALFFTYDKFCAILLSNDSSKYKTDTGVGLVILNNNRYYLVGVSSLLLGMLPKNITGKTKQFELFTRIESYTTYILEMGARYGNL